MEEGDAQPRVTGPRERWIWGGQIFTVLLLIWLVLNGLEDWWLGVLAALAGAVFGAWLVSGEPHPWKPHRMVAFCVFFLVESLRGGFDVAWRALHPSLKIGPETIHYPISLPPGQPRTLMVSVVSLLPGTLSVDLEDQGRDLVVHALFPGASDSVVRLERWVVWLFSLEDSQA